MIVLIVLTVLMLQIGLFNQIDLRHVPGLFRLLLEGETLDDLRKLSPEQILIRWVNYHLAKVFLLQFIRMSRFSISVCSVVHFH